MEEFLFWALVISGSALIAWLAGPTLLRVAGGVITVAALVGILVKAPADATISAVLTGAALLGLGTWWRSRRLQADRRDAQEADAEARADLPT